MITIDDQAFPPVGFPAGTNTFKSLFAIKIFPFAPSIAMSLLTNGVKVLAVWSIRVLRRATVDQAWIKSSSTLVA